MDFSITSSKVIVRALIFLVIAAIIVVGGLIIKVAIVGDRPAAPRTYAEKLLWDAEEAVKADPEDSKARIGLARAYLTIGRNADGLKQAEAAVKLGRKSSEAYFVLGLGYNKTGNYAKAVEVLQACVKQENATLDILGESYFQMGIAYEGLNKLKEAMQAYDKALNYFPEDINLNYAYAKVLEKAGKRTDAIVVYKDILSYVPGEQKAQDALKRLGAR